MSTLNKLMVQECIRARIVAPLAVLALVGPFGAAQAQTCPRTCDPALFNSCDATAAVTDSPLQVGGQGAFLIGDPLDCEENDGTQEDVEANATFHWERGVPCGNQATCARLTLTLVNATCQPTTAKLTRAWFNSPPSLLASTLVLAQVNGVNKNWKIENVTGGGVDGAGCFGSFDWKLSVAQGGINNAIPPGGSGVFMINFTGSGMGGTTACDLAGGVSDGGLPTHMVLHFQNTDNQAGSEKASSNCNPGQFVDLASFTVTPDDRRVTVDWTTSLEIDNAGFYLLRRNTLTGEMTRLNPGLIPAQGDIYEGTSYQYVDETAVNGVKYSYHLIDVDYRGAEGSRPGLLTVANPRRPGIRLVAPTYGSAELRPGDRASFQFETPGLRTGALMISADPTFADRHGSLIIPLSSWKYRSGRISLLPGQAGVMERIARGNHGVVYWKIVGTGLDAQERESATYTLGYSTLQPTAKRLKGEDTGAGR